MTQNKQKAEHIAIFCRPGQDPSTKTVRTYLTQYDLRTLKHYARYLGAWPHYQGSTAVVVNTRIN